MPDKVEDEGRKKKMKGRGTGRGGEGCILPAADP
jgi:hypothetical protein